MTVLTTVNINTMRGNLFSLIPIALAILTFAVKSIGADVIIRPEIFLVIHFFQAFAEVIVGSMVGVALLSSLVISKMLADGNE
jgi:hypothetical protein